MGRRYCRKRKKLKEMVRHLIEKAQSPEISLDHQDRLQVEINQLQRKLGT